MDGLEKFRNEIDSIDNEIMTLLDKRFKVTNEVGQYKLKNNIEVTHTNREHYILEKCNDFSYQNELKEIYKVMFNLSKNNQRG